MTDKQCTQYTESNIGGDFAPGISRFCSLRSSEVHRLYAFLICKSRLSKYCPDLKPKYKICTTNCLAYKHPGDYGCEKGNLAFRPPLGKRCTFSLLEGQLEKTPAQSSPKSIEIERCNCGGVETVISSPIDTVETCKSCGGTKKD